MGGSLLNETGGLLLDTHIWFWYLAGSAKLPVGLREAIDEDTERCWLSPLSVWELALLAERGRVQLVGSFRDWVASAQRLLPLREATLNTEVAIVSRELSLPHEDPADRFLAATALVYGLTLLTADRRLTRARWLKTRSR